ncbi:MAG: phosphate starvation-inducible protein PhoH [Candidatus Niyogibacteria bacterium CG10_big_fil_rev_8_21_14_0_10_46_36]|uniref:Phosphate starvation-inducible protein PhoH n=1 Tax=Candidatus Niyogibacteria bacterium CG10_big_fil_rev_8_21_14_0_10_46_36 TaxID=1974726 RepID=A0A2H0TFZ2_9BACT|nr:MAG: phosphate starvation-inducible protein PhoH [Candidatus Niyogibacteria bacterium CG10_big_fil_rev_8_21_14_0_10_46_36]
MEQKQNKRFVLDTSVLIHDHKALEHFSEHGHDIVIPTWVVDELDRFKHEQGYRGVNSRKASKLLEKMEHDRRLRIEFRTSKEAEAAKSMESNNDLRIILCAKYVQEEHAGDTVILVSKDTNLRIKARACGIAAEDYKSDKIISSIADLYKHPKEVQIEDGAFLDKLLRDFNIVVDEWKELYGSEYYPNECCRFMLRDTERFALARFLNGKFHRVDKPQIPPKDKRREFASIHPINEEQAFAYHLLTAPEVHLVTLAGDAGTGKTLISLLAGAIQVKGDLYDQILVFRPNIEIGRSLGALPGTVDEKFEPWKQPIFDNLSLILRSDKELSAVFKKNGSKDKDISNAGLSMLLKSERIEISPITFLRGRSFNRKFVIIDDVQNLTPQEVKTVITRMGEGTKVVLAGDVSQIDDPHLDPISNGLAYTVARWQGQDIFGHVALQKGERSRLAELASKLM